MAFTSRLARRGFGGQTCPDRAADRHVRRGPSSAAQAHRAAGLRLRRDLVHGLRHRRDPHRAARPGGHRRRGVEQAGPARGGRRRAVGDRRAVVSPDHLRLPLGRRLVRRVAREPRRDAVARRRGVVAHRLHPDRGGVGGWWRAGDPVRVRLRQRVPGADRAGADRRHDGRQPARLEGVGVVVRPADLHLHDHADAAHRRRLLPNLLPEPRPDPPVRSVPGRTGNSRKEPSRSAS